MEFRNHCCKHTCLLKDERLSVFVFAVSLKYFIVQKIDNRITHELRTYFPLHTNDKLLPKQKYM